MPALAAGPVKLTGSIPGEPDVRITMKVQRNGGQPSAVKVFTVKELDFSCFGDDEPGEFRLRLENAFEVQRTFDAEGKRVWNVFNRRDTVLTDEFGGVGVSIFGTTNRKASRMSGNIGFSFGDGCINSTDGFDEYALAARD